MHKVPTWAFIVGLLAFGWFVFTPAMMWMDTTFGASNWVLAAFGLLLVGVTTYHIKADGSGARAGTAAGRQISPSPSAGNARD
jgi:hypothetical protein